jgi:hypothetical protein
MFGSSGVTVLLADGLPVEIEDATLGYACDDMMIQQMNILICDERECGPPLNWPWSAKQSLFVDYLLVYLKQTIRCAHNSLPMSGNLSAARYYLDFFFSSSSASRSDLSS